MIGVLLHALWHDAILARRGLRRWRRPPLERWAGIARDFRGLALELGGVLIKLGQFLSTRVDVLPLEITRELAGLQDRVPAVSFGAIAARIEADLGRSLAALYAEIEEEPVGAASLAQAHRARLAALPPGEEAADGTLVAGDRVVVKVLRPGIEQVVETDLAALSLAVRWLERWPTFQRHLRRRVDLRRLFVEFAATTRDELDMRREAAHAEHFGEIFRDDPAILVPRVVGALSGTTTLTLEDVGYIRMSDHAAIEAAGVALPEVARTLYRAYMEQVFVHHFLHCDPHPGNLFVRPLAPGDPGGGGELGLPFQIAFVDFGMMTTIPERLRESLQEGALAMVSRDSRRLVGVLRDAEILLPGADLRRIEEIHQLMLDRLWGVPLADIQGVAMEEARLLIREYRDLLYQAPFQFPVDLLFTLRAVGLLAGMATSLDPAFDPWNEAMPFVRGLAAETAGEMAKRRLEEGVELLRTLGRLPAGVERVLSLAEGVEGDGLRVRADLAPDTVRLLRRLERSWTRLSWMVAAAALFLGGLQIELARPGSPAALGLWAAAVGCFLWSLLRR